MKDHQFSIPQTRLILMGLCLIAIQVLFYAAGVATGVMIAPGSKVTAKEILAKTPAAPELPKPAAPKLEPVNAKAATPMPEMAAVTTPEKPAAGAAMDKATAPAASVPAASVPAASVPTSSAPASSAPASSVPSAAAPAASAANASAVAQAEPDDTRVLAIQVASFHTRDGAQNFAEVLRRSGFSPVTVGEQDRADEIWHYVRLGPYRDWDEAARISAEVDRSYDLHSYIRLIRVSN